MKLSYLITCSTETTTLQSLFDRVIPFVEKDDDVVVLTDSDVQDRQSTLDIVSKAVSGRDNFSHIDRSLSRNYGAHKNTGMLQCKGDFVLQLDGDEVPTEILLLNIKDIIQSNPGIELFFISRVNDYIGVTEEHARQWGWRLTPCPACGNRLIVNHPDFQGRLFLNEPSRIKWDRRLHEKIEGHNSYAFLPADNYELALFHYKTIQKQLETNKRYNIWFTQEENKGHGVV